MDTLPVIPVIAGAVRTRALEILSSPAGSTNRRDVVAKVGASITESGAFLVDNGCILPPEVPAYGAYTSLIPVTEYFTGYQFPATYTLAWCGIANSFTRYSHSAMFGAVSSWPMSASTLCAAPNNTRLRCEYSLLRPSFALILIGTNDLLQNVNNDLTASLAAYRANLQAIVDTSASMGVVPVLSTLSPLVVTSGYVTQAQADRLGAYNQTIADVAEASSVPLWNYHRALHQLGPSANYGISWDGIHPSVYLDSDPSSFTAAALQSGYNVRNLNAIQVLAALKTSLIDAQSAPSIGTTSLPNAVVGGAYSTTVAVAGNPTPTCAATGLPAGLSISAACVISGTPSAAGTFPVTITATNGVVPAASSSLSLVVVPRTPPTITTTSLPGGSQLLSYSATVTATGDPAPTFAATGLPTGLTINTTTGVISGTPSVAGTFAVTVTATNGIAPDASATLSLTIAPRIAPTITTTSLPRGAQRVAYTATVAATGTPTPTFSATGLPTGLTINSTTGVISGTPTGFGTFTVRVTASNGVSPNATATYSLVITAGIAPTITSGAPPNGTRDIAYTFRVTATGTPTPTFSASSLPRGLTINTTTGVISGIPNRRATYFSTIRALNGISPTASRVYTIVIN